MWSIHSQRYLSQIYSYVSRWGLTWYVLTIFRVLRGFESAFRRTACFRRELLGSVWPLLSMDHLIWVSRQSFCVDASLISRTRTGKICKGLRSYRYHMSMSHLQRRNIEGHATSHSHARDCSSTRYVVPTSVKWRAHLSIRGDVAQSHIPSAGEPGAHHWLGRRSCWWFSQRG